MNKDIWDLFLGEDEGIPSENGIGNAKDTTLSDQIQSVGLDLDGDDTIDRIILGVDFDGDGSIDQILGEVNLDDDSVVNGLLSISRYSENEADFNFDFDALTDASDKSSIDFDGFAAEEMGLNFGENVDMLTNIGDEHIFEAENTFFTDSESIEQINMEELASVDTYETFDPDEIDNQNIIGNPEAYMDNWHPQETDFSCAIAAQEFAIEELLDIDIDESELRKIAFENGWLTENGTTIYDIGKLMEHMGLNVERSFNNTLEDLCACLERGCHPVVSVDADELWSGYNEELFFPGRDANHAIQVIGVDLSDPDDPMVIINDSGVANGCGAMVSAELFLDAWEDSSCYMVEAYA